MKRVAVVLMVLSCVEIFAGGQARFASRAVAVTLDVSVTDGGRPVGGLTTKDFIVTDNGVVQEVEDLTAAQLPIDVHVTADISGSLTARDRGLILGAINGIRPMLRAEDRLSVTEFWSHISERVAPTAGPPPLEQLGSGLNTAAIDALLLALARPDLADRRQLSVFLTDGMDTTSYFSTDALARTARAARSPLTLILVPDRAKGGAGALRAAALATGGEAIVATSHERLMDVFTQALNNFRASYVLRYVPTGVPTEGWHSVKVRTANARHMVRTRTGYDVPKAVSR